MDNICKDESCTGCGLCSQLCPVNCIEMKENKEGFLRPVIDKDKCKKCNLCKKKCPANNEIKNNSNKSAYASYTKDKEILMNSSSGGIFYELAKNIINNNGVVFGTIYAEDMSVMHEMVDNSEDIKKLLGSKYVQSDTNNVYKKVKQQLKLGKKVLFAGTPCQVYALKTYIGKENENLITIDFICTGVPSRLIYKDYLKSLKITPRTVSFRDKKHGWKHFGMKVTGKKGKMYELRYFNKYIQAMYNHLSIMKSCYNCKFKELISGSDIKLGDFWGIENLNMGLDYINGVSIVMLNSDKACHIFNEIKDNLIYKEVSLDSIYSTNTSFFKCASNEKRDEFFKEYMTQNNINDKMKILDKYTKKSAKDITNIKIIVGKDKLKYILNKLNIRRKNG